MNTVPGTNVGNNAAAAAQLVRPLAVTPMGAAMSPMVPSPLAMDPVSFQQWWTAVSSLNGSRPGTPLNMVNAAQVPFRMSSPTLEQMQAQLQQQHQQQLALGQQQPDIAALTAFANRQAQAQQQKSAKKGAGQGGQKGTAQQKGSKKQGGGTGTNSSRSPSPANLSNSRQNSQLQAGEGNLPLKASRHKYAEQRRRNRINERLDQLRTLVPHTEGSNIAGFLDQVIEYVMKLQQQLNIEPQGHQDQVVLPSVAQIKNLLNSNGNGNSNNTKNDSTNENSEGDAGKADQAAPAPSKKRSSSKSSSEDGELPSKNKDVKKARKD